MSAISTFLAAAITLACVQDSGRVVAGPEGDPPPRQADARPEGARPEARQWDRGAVKARLNGLLEDLRRLEAGVLAVLDRVERGDDIASVMGDIERLRATVRPGTFLAPFVRNQGDAGDAPRLLTPEERRRLLGFMNEHLPRMAARMRDLAAREPAGHDRLLNRMAPRLLEAEAIRELEPERFRLKVAELAASADVADAGRELMELMRAGRANRGAIQAAEARLRTAVAARFDAHVALQADEVATLSARVEKLRREFEDLKAARDERIDAECQRMMQRLRRQGDGGPDRRPLHQRGPGTRPDDGPN